MASLPELIIALFKTDSWEAGQRVVAQHPELLSPAADFFLEIYAMSTKDKQARQAAEIYRGLLARCREVGVEQAFAEKKRPARGYHTGYIEHIPTGFETDMAEIQRLEMEWQHNELATEALIQVYERMIAQLLPGQHLTFRAALYHNLGSVYAQLPVGDRAANLERALACLHEALRVFTREAAPFDYASIQNGLGSVYAQLPVGDRAANLERALACFYEAVRIFTFEAAPFEYARTLNGLGNVYTILHTGNRAANLRHAIACYEEALRIFTPETAPFDYAGAKHGLALAHLGLLGNE